MDEAARVGAREVLEPDAGGQHDDQCVEVDAHADLCDDDAHEEREHRCAVLDRAHEQTEQHADRDAERERPEELPADRERGPRDVDARTE
jgi:hypothetical protein